MASGKKVYSSLSTAVSAKPALSRPLITIRRLSGKQRITWRKVSGATGYILYQRTGSGVFRKIKTLTSRSTYWSVTTKKGTSYSYKLVPYLRVNGKLRLALQVSSNDSKGQITRRNPRERQRFPGISSISFSSFSLPPRQRPETKPRYRALQTRSASSGR